jgi:hypothetical protein
MGKKPTKGEWKKVATKVAKNVGGSLAIIAAGAYADPTLVMANPKFFAIASAIFVGKSRLSLWAPPPTERTPFRLPSFPNPTRPR